VKKINEMDYLTISARIHAMENRLLTRERMDRLMEVCSAEEASRVLSECGYPELSELSLGGIERMLAASRGELRKDLRESAPDSKVVDLFFIPYDYHNVKVVLKAKATGQDADRLFIDCGRYPAAQLKEEVLQGTLQHETAVFTQAAMSAEAALDQDSSPQAADQILDRACYAEMLDMARETGSAFLEGYVRISIDCVNLRTTVRCRRISCSPDYLKNALLPGGNIDPSAFLAVATGATELNEVIGHGFPAEAVLAGTEDHAEDSLMQFERLCSIILTVYFAKTKNASFGELSLIGYLHAKLSEFTIVRVILTGRLAGLDAEAIRERLGDMYA